MHAISIHPCNTSSLNKLSLLPCCEMRTHGRIIVFYHRLSQHVLEFSGSTYLTPIVAEMVISGAPVEQLEQLLCVWSKDGKKVLSILLEEGYLG